MMDFKYKEPESPNSQASAAFQRLSLTSLISPVGSAGRRLEARLVAQPGQRFFWSRCICSIEADQPQLWGKFIQDGEVIEFLPGDVAIHTAGSNAGVIGVPNPYTVLLKATDFVLVSRAH